MEEWALWIDLRHRGVDIADCPRLIMMTGKKRRVNKFLPVKKYLLEDELRVAVEVLTWKIALPTSLQGMLAQSFELISFSSFVPFFRSPCSFSDITDDEADSTGTSRHGDDFAEPDERTGLLPPPAGISSNEYYDAARHDLGYYRGIRQPSSGGHSERSDMKKTVRHSNMTYRQEESKVRYLVRHSNFRFGPNNNSQFFSNYISVNARDESENLRRVDVHDDATTESLPDRQLLHRWIIMQQSAKNKPEPSRRSVQGF